MFLGKFFYGLDNKYRFQIPIEFKEDLTGDIFVTQGFDHNLLVLPEDVFRDLYKKLSGLNITDPLARLLFRLFLGAANEVKINAHGYLTIPKDLLGYAEIDNEILVIGQGDYFEIWSTERWRKQEAEIRNTESNTERFSTFVLTTR